MRKHFIVPESIPLFHGDNRIKMGNGGIMLMWYRRDFGSILITNKTYEQPIECIAVKLKKRESYWRSRMGCLYHMPEIKDESEKGNPLNYLYCVGKDRYMGWRNGMPESYHIDTDLINQCYLIGESYNEYVTNLIKKG